MKGDFTRFTHRPEKHYTRVLKQQGRVDLDADWNESVEIATHLERTEAIDVIGRCGVPIHGGGFEIDHAGAQLTISRGRIYVDGILCSNEAAGQESASPGEPGPVALDEQEDLPDYAPSLSTGVYLVYLDVWERHVTALEDPEIREVALGGPDTTTRTRTVCQVKLEHLGFDAPLHGLECRPHSALPADGRLAARAEAADDPSNPCAVPAAAGYRGLENRLYRVEIHGDGRSGSPATPTFKWSRDNGSVVLPIADGGIDGTEVTLKRLGPDEVLTVKVGDWVEVSDDDTELYGRPGTLGRIADGGIDKASLTITLEDSGGGPVDLSAHVGEGHLKLRRWDHHATDDVTLLGGALPIQGGWFELEDGVEVRFAAAATYHTGDYWVIPARTREGTVEWPREEGASPPAGLALPRLGIEHHYCTLALARREGKAWTEVRDCRPRFPPLTEVSWCCVTVAPGEDIQKALDSLPDGSVDPEWVGGCVCLKTGVHEITAPLRIETSNVVLHGEGPGAVVRRTGIGSLLLEMTEVSDCRVQDIRFESRADAGARLMLVYLKGCHDVTLQGCRLEASPHALTGVLISDSHGVRVDRCSVSGVLVGVEVRSDSTGAEVRANRLTGSGVPDDQRYPDGLVGVVLRGAGASRVEGNRIANFQIGARVYDDAEGSVVAANRIQRKALRPGADPMEDKAFGIDVAAPRCLVRDNVIAIPGAAYGGIRIGFSEDYYSVDAVGVCVEKNRLRSSFLAEAEADAVQPLGIQVGSGQGEHGATADDAVIRGNLLTGMMDAVEVIRSSGVQILDNEIGADDKSLHEAIGLVLTQDVRVAGNRVRGFQTGVRLAYGGGHRIFDNHFAGGEVGVLAADQDSLEVGRNRIEETLDAIEVTDSSDVQVTGNDVEAGRLSLRQAIGLDGVTGARVAGNRVQGAEIGIRLQDGAGNRVFDNRLESGGAGIVASEEDSLAIDRNTILDMRQPGILAAVLGTSIALSGNRLVSCAYAPTGSLPATAGLLILASPEVRVESCEILGSGISPSGDATVLPAAGILLALVAGCAVQGNLVKVPNTLDRSREDRALWVLGSLAFRIDLVTSERRRTLAYSVGGASVLENKFYGPGRTALVEVPWIELTRPADNYSIGLGFDRLDFSHNNCEHYAGQEQGKVRATASLAGIRMVVIGNHVRGLPESLDSSFVFHSFDFHNERTVLFTGNMATGATIRHPNPRPMPIDDHNFLNLIL